MIKIHNAAAGAQMRPMAATLADEQAMRDVVSYINTLAQDGGPR